MNNELNRPHSSTAHTPEDANTPDAGSEIIEAKTNMSRGDFLKQLGMMGGLVVLSNVLAACGEEGGEVVEPIDNRSETQKYTPEQWLAKTGIKAEDTPEKGLGAITMLNTPVKGNDGLYYIKPDIRLNKDVIKELGLKVVQTSGRPIEEMHVYINFRSASALDGAQGYEKSYADVMSSEGELRASQLSLNPLSQGRDMEKLYRPGSAFIISISIQPTREVWNALKAEGIMTIGNQENFSQSSVFSYALAN